MNRSPYVLSAFAIFSLLLAAPAQAIPVYDSSEMHIHDHIDTAYRSPQLQFMDNVPITKISCQESFELIMKATNGMPACVRPATAAILIERGWGMHVLPDYKNGDNNSQMLKTYSGEFTVTGGKVTYFEDYVGYIAAPTSDGTFPGIVMIHEWWGLNDNITQMADELASHGYVVLAVNLFGVDAATTPEEARALTSAYVPEMGLENMNGAIEYLRANYNVPNIGSIGWCFGGAQSLALALNNDMDATVIYYGSVVTDKERLSSINWPVLGIFGELDMGIPVESVRAFENSLNDLGIENQIHIYPGVGHAFANPSGERYAPAETVDAWEKTTAFFHDVLKSRT